MNCRRAAAAKRKLLAPVTLARMLQAAAVVPGDRALDVGGGSGYCAALLDAMGAKVVMLESDSGAAAAARAELKGRANVVVVEGSLERGAADRAPFDLIVVEGAFAVSPDSLLALLADPGRLVGIDASREPPQAVLYEKIGAALSRQAAVRDPRGHPRRLPARGELRLLKLGRGGRRGSCPNVRCLMFATLGGKISAYAPARPSVAWRGEDYRL